MEALQWIRQLRANRPRVRSSPDSGYCSGSKSDLRSHSSPDVGPLAVNTRLDPVETPTVSYLNNIRGKPVYAF